MSASWILIAELALAASAAILVVAAIRKPLRRIGGSRVAYLSWLLVPASQIVVLLPEPSRPLGPAAQTIPEWMLNALPAVMSSTNDVADASYATIGVVVWVSGSLVMLFFATLRQRRFIQSLGEMTAMPDGTWRSSVVRGPLLVGVLHPRVVLPMNFEALFDAEERALVLAHERAHRDHGDQLVNVIATTWLCLFWFNPLMYWAIGLLRFDQDLTCDAVVLAGRSASRRRYAGALLKAQLAFETGWSLPAVSSWQSGHPLKERIVMLKRPLPPFIRRCSVTLLTCALIAAGSYAVWMTLPRAADAQISPARAAGAVLNEAITFLNAGQNTEAKLAIGTLDLSTLTPFERRHVEMVLFNLALQEGRLDDARDHLEESVSGLPPEEAARARYQGTEALKTAEGR